MVGSQGEQSGHGAGCFPQAAFVMLASAVWALLALAVESPIFLQVALGCLLISGFGALITFKRWHATPAKVAARVLALPA